MERLMKPRVVWTLLLLVAASAALCPRGTAMAARPSAEEAAREILAQTGVQGGLVVHVGCGDGKLTAALHRSDSFLVHGLGAPGPQIEQARAHIRSLGLYGKVWVEPWSAERLPYIDNCVNLVVSEDLGRVPLSEVMRALAPGGVAYVKSGGVWQKTVKPRPAQMDEWTHYLHDPSNNAVAHDSLIEPPGSFQWVGGPRYSRHHDHMSSLSACVSANGRVFYIFDEAPRALILTPPRWQLIARDAFNGTLLWKRTIERWHHHLWPLKSGPQTLTRRLVAVGDRVYVTLDVDGPLCELDAATGNTLRTYEGTTATEEVLHLEGVLLLVVAAQGQPLRSDPAKPYANLKEIAADVTHPLWTEAPRTVMAVNAQTGEVLWARKSNVVPMSLAADRHRVLFHDGQRIQCLRRTDGQTLWSSEPLAKQERMRSSAGVTLVLYEDVVLYSGFVATEKYKQASTTMFALSAKDGKLLWKGEHPPCGHMGTPKDILVAGGLVWCGAVAQGTDSGIMTGRDPHTGQIQSEFPPDVQTHWFHHRCYRAKATDKYLLFSRTGIEFIDHANKHWIPHHWVRGACLYGVMPCNGLIYAPQHPCACYLEAKLFGFVALAPPRKARTAVGEGEDAARLERGPAYEARPAEGSAAEADPERDWPTYRHDPARSGASPTTVPADNLRCTWTARLGGRLSSPVVAGGKVFVASIDTHTVHALAADSGTPAWSFTAGARVDSPPTVWRGRVLFGSADGYVYCLRAEDGQLIWRFRAAPEDLRMGAFEQVESVWPVHGSVLVQNGVVYCVAGRSMFLDGGLRLLRLDPATGRKLSETIFDDRVPQTQENLQSMIRGLNMPVALPDILSSDGRYVYMHSLPLDLEGNRKFVAYVEVKDQRGDDVHLFTPTGFLDDTLWHRTYWVFGRAWASGAGGYYQAGRLVPAGRILVFDQSTVYGYGRLWQYYRWTTPLEFHLFAAAKQPEIVISAEERKAVKKAGKRTDTVRTTPFTRFVSNWSNQTSVQATAMVLTQGTLFAAGPPDVENEEQSAKSLADPQVQARLAEQSAALEGRRGGLLVAVRAADGQRLVGYRLDAMPVFDGMIAAGGRLYLTTAEGTVLCLGAGQGQPLPQTPEATAAPRPRDPVLDTAPSKPALRRRKA
ncbi:MAG: outer membrane protein assembly factor BamB family protein [Thermoguttaceae bacterium]